MFPTFNFHTSKYKIPLLILLFVIAYLFLSKFLTTIFIDLSRNIFLSKNAFDSEITALRADNIQLRLDAQRLKSLEEENQRLRTILDFKEHSDIEVIPLGVIIVEPSRFRNIIIAEGGSDAGIEENMFAVDQHGYVIGRVLRVYKEYSEICLISDPSFYATVSVAQVLGLLKGTAAGEAKIFYLEPTTVVNKGDKVSVQLPNSSYELEVGMVKEVGYDRNSLFLDVDVLPLAGPQRSKFIFIVKTASKKPR